VTHPKDKVTQGLFDLWFKPKKFYSVLNVKGACPLTLPERLVHSFTAYRTAKGGTTIREIHRATRLHRNTIRQAIEKLTSRLLIAKDGDRYHAPEPPQMAEWFVPAKHAGSNWFTRLVSFPVAWTPKGWSYSETALYFLLFCGNVQDGRQLRSSQSRAGLAAMLSINPKTVARAWPKYERFGLVEDGYLKIPSDEVLSLFADRPRKAVKKWRASIACGWNLQGQFANVMRRCIDELSEKMMAADYSKEDVLEYWRRVAKAGRTEDVLNDFLVGSLDRVWTEAETTTSRYRNDGKFKGKNSLGLVSQSSEKAIQEIIQEHHRAKLQRQDEERERREMAG
jgi:hypothetical protein